MIEHARDALHDREPESEAARDLRALIEPVKFAENRALLRLRDAEPGVVHIDPQLAVARPAADQDAAFGRVLDGVRHQVLQQPAQQPPVGTHRARARHKGQRQALLARERRELDFELAHHLVDAEAGNLRSHRAGIEPRDVEQRAEDFLDGLKRGIDVGDESRVLAAAFAARPGS